LPEKISELAQLQTPPPIGAGRGEAMPSSHGKEGKTKIYKMGNIRNIPSEMF